MKRLHCHLKLVNAELHLQILHFEEDRHNDFQHTLGDAVDADLIRRDPSVLIAVELAEQPSHSSGLHVAQDHFRVGIDLQFRLGWLLMYLVFTHFEQVLSNALPSSVAVLRLRYDVRSKQRLASDRICSFFSPHFVEETFDLKHLLLLKFAASLFEQALVLHYLKGNTVEFRLEAMPFRRDVSAYGLDCAG